MKFVLSEAMEILHRTPQVLDAQLCGLSDEWLHANEGPGTWTPHQVVGHLIINEKTNFLPRTLLVMSANEDKTLQPIDMDGHMTMFNGMKIAGLVAEFTRLRNDNLRQLKALHLSTGDMQRTATHPRVGTVTLENILSTWVAHDLTHLGQITRVLAKQYREEIGPFIEFLTRLK